MSEILRYFYDIPTNFYKFLRNFQEILDHGLAADPDSGPGPYPDPGPAAVKTCEKLKHE